MIFKSQKIAFIFELSEKWNIIYILFDCLFLKEAI